MTQTVKKTLTKAPQEIANSATHTSFTLQNKSSLSIAVFIDNRTEAERTAAGDTEPYTIGPYEERAFNGFEGSVNAYVVNGDSAIVVMVIS